MANVKKPKTSKVQKPKITKKTPAMVPMGRTMMRSVPSKCEKALLNGTLTKTAQGKLVRTYRGKDGKMKKTYCASNLQRRGAMGAINANRLRPYTKGGAPKVSKKVMGMRKASSVCEKKYKNASLSVAKSGKLFRMVKGKDGKMRKTYCDKNLLRRGINPKVYPPSSAVPNLTNRLRIISNPMNSMSSTTSSNIALLNSLHRALNLVPVSPARQSPPKKSPPKKSPAKKSPPKVNSDGLVTRLKNQGFGKHAKKIAAMMRASGRPASNYSRQTGKLKVSAKKMVKKTSPSYHHSKKH
jgi:hypothetical protein